MFFVHIRIISKNPRTSLTIKEVRLASSQELQAAKKELWRLIEQVGRGDALYGCHPLQNTEGFSKPFLTYPLLGGSNF